MSEAQAAERPDLLDGKAAPLSGAGGSHELVGEEGIDVDTLRGTQAALRGRDRLPYGTRSTATTPPNPSATVATPLGTTHSLPSTSRLK